MNAQTGADALDEVIAPMARCFLCGKTAVFNVVLGPYSFVESQRWSKPTANHSRHGWLCDEHFAPYRDLWVRLGDA